MANRFHFAVIAILANTAPLLAAGGKGELEVRVIDKDTGKPIAARMHLKDAKGKPVYGDVVNGSEKARANGRAALQQRAAGRAADIAPTIKSLQAAGATSLRAIAAGLNAQGIPTARGGGQWSAVQVARVLERV